MNKESEVSQVGVGFSQKHDAVSAVQEALAQARQEARIQGKIDWILAFFTPPFIHDAEFIRKTLIQQTQCDHLAGCSGAGVITLRQELSGLPAIALMIGCTPQLKLQSFVNFQESTHASSVPQQLKESIESFAESQPLCLLLADAYQLLPYNLINALKYSKSKPITFGVGSSDDGSMRKSAQIGMSCSTHKGISGFLMTGMKQVVYGVTQSCAPVGDPMFITKVNENQILTLDGFSALDVYSTQASQLGLTHFEEAARQLLLGFPLNKERPSFEGESCLARQLSEIDVSSKGLLVPHMVEEGGILNFLFRSSMAAEQDMLQMLERLQAKQPAKPTFGIYFNCTARGPNLYEKDNVDTQNIRDTFGNFPLLGVYGGYELATVPEGLNLYSFTGVLVLFYL